MILHSRKENIAYLKKRVRKKGCYFTKNKIKYIDYKDVETIRMIITSGGRFSPRRLPGTSAKYQGQLKTAIERARFMALLPYVED